jgi:hypothetical protein
MLLWASASGTLYTSEYDGKHVVLRAVCHLSIEAMKFAARAWEMACPMLSMRSPPSHRQQPRLNPGGAIQWCKIQRAASRIQNRRPAYSNYPFHLANKCLDSVVTMAPRLHVCSRAHPCTAQLPLRIVSLIHARQCFPHSRLTRER